MAKWDSKYIRMERQLKCCKRPTLDRRDIKTLIVLSEVLNGVDQIIGYNSLRLQDDFTSPLISNLSQLEDKAKTYHWNHPIPFSSTKFPNSHYLHLYNTSMYCTLLLPLSSYIFPGP